MNIDMRELVTPEVTMYSVVGIQAPNLQAITADKYGYLYITLPCGESRHYLIPDELPATSDECHCGTLAYPHWFIRYEEEEKASE